MNDIDWRHSFASVRRIETVADIEPAVNWIRDEVHSLRHQATPHAEVVEALATRVCALLDYTDAAMYSALHAALDALAVECGVTGED